MAETARRTCIQILALAGLAFWAVAPARAENPRVSLKIDNATAAEAVAQLSSASGIRIELTPGPVVGGLGPALEQKTSFDWTNTTFARALRQVCEKYNLRAGRRLGGYTLYSGFNAPAPAPRLTSVVEKAGMRFFPRSVTVEDRRTLNLADDGAPDQGYGYLQFQLGVELGDGDAEMVAGIENVSAKDDTGNLLTADTSRMFYGAFLGQTFPDEWSGGITLSLPDPKAKRLLWIQGDLTGYRIVKPSRVEITLPIIEKNARREVGDWLIVVSNYQANGIKAEEEEGLPHVGFQPAANGPTMRVRVYYPNGTRLTSRSGWGTAPVLVDTGGRIYTAIRSTSSGYGDAQMMLSDSTLTFPPTTDPPAKLVWDLVERSEPVRLCTFRLTDIRLPGPQNFVARKSPPPAAPAGDSGETDHPYYERGGGTLRTRVQLGDRPAGLGTLQIGLAPKTGIGWGPNRWMEVPVDAEGLAALKDIKPGVYRLLRTFHPASALPGAGHWLGAETVVTVVTGKDTVSGPLRWEAGTAGRKPERRPASSGK